MRIAVMGAGGLGGFYGGKLVKHGEAVTFIARGKHLTVIQNSGLRLIGDKEKILLKDVNATNNPRDIGPVDLILFCVKLYDVESAAALIKPIITKDTVVISLLNGINGPERLSKTLGKGIICAGSARVSARILEPGTIRFLGDSDGHTLTFGHKEKNLPIIAHKFCEICNFSGFPAQISNNIEVELWDKLIQLTCVAGLTTLARKPMGVVLEEPNLFAIGEKILMEVEAIARSKNIALSPNIFENKIKLICSFPRDLYASMYHDLVAGKRMEVEDIFGYLANEGEKNNIQTPIIDFLYAFLKPHMNGAKRL